MLGAYGNIAVLSVLSVLWRDGGSRTFQPRRRVRQAGKPDLRATRAEAPAPFRANLSPIGYHEGRGAVWPGPRDASGFGSRVR